ncbi:type VII secretion-associated serine protease mycosin [Microbacterium halimionae]|uniref:Type VII secretion-associated serine protease mycosin n=1 Tax=Microbacterium halimionae TaxID=1526413 RepID=A0A7W3PKM8_9MICO|nr:S8 family serine peptidase [Microbacterium halimionae]MBA8815037.1 type VII secretion-associated serine protease mycosin [Microbacterium halimionae]NII94172.1 type VII secretion-associated serine protease mycosin [Microbacterium halimionae]
MAVAALCINVCAATAAQAVPLAAVAQDQCTASTRIDQPVAALDLMQSGLAWGITRGEGVTVAVVDSGVNVKNPHLARAVSGGINLVGDGTDASGFTDSYGHGTAIAGQIAARETDGSGVVGLAPETRILSVRVFAGTGSNQVDAGYGPSAERLAEGIRWAADHGAQIINVSMSTTVDEPSLHAAVTYAQGVGSLVVASSGNRDSTLAVEEDDADGSRYPAADPAVLGVAATDEDGIVTEESIHGSHVAVSALGQNVLTTSAAGGDCVYASDAPATSFATGYVSAAAALVAAAHPDETPQQWAYRLKATAVRPIADQRNDSSGWGVVQPYEAIALIPGAGIEGPSSPFGDAVTDEDLGASVEPVRIVNEEQPDAEALRIGGVISVGALVLLAIAGALGVFLVRYRARVNPATRREGRGLYNDGAPPRT